MSKLYFKLSPNEINSKVFQGKNGGYDSLEVDKYLDLVVSDYIAFEQFKLENDKIEKENNELKKSLENYRAKISQLEYENTSMKEKIDAYSKNGNNLDNIELLQRISTLEQELYNLGKDPSKIR